MMFLSPILNSDYFLKRHDLSLFVEAVQMGKLHNFLFQDCYFCKKDKHGNMWVDNQSERLIFIQDIDYSPAPCEIFIDQRTDRAYLHAHPLYSAILLSFWVMVYGYRVGNFLFWNGSAPLSNLLQPYQYDIIATFSIPGEYNIGIKSEGYNYQIREQLDEISQVLYGEEGKVDLKEDVEFLDVQSVHQIAFPYGTADGEGYFNRLDFSLRLSQAVASISWVINEDVGDV
jgi:hypothetical protein